MAELIVRGDIDGDKKITKKDLLLLQRHLAHAIVLTEKQLAAADVNNDGKINILDLVALRKHLDGTEILTEVFEYEVQ